MASDSQGTEESGGVRRSVTKLFPLTGRAVWGGSGPEQIIEEIRQELERERAAFEQAEAIGPSLRNYIRPILKPHYDSYLPQVPGIPEGSPATWVLACGFTPGGRPYIVEIDPVCMYTHYEEVGFHAIGSGAGFAQMANSQMAHFQTKDRPTTHGLLVGYRTMDAVIETSGQYVGGPIQMWLVSEGGARALTPEELAEVATNVGGWKEEERATLDRVVGGVPLSAPEPMPPEVPPPPAS